MLRARDGRGGRYRGGPFFGRSAAAGGNPPEWLSPSLVLFGAMSSAPSTARMKLIDETVRRLVETGIWSKLDVLYVLAAHDEQAGRLNWKTPGTYTCTAVNSPTFEADRGFTGDGATSRLLTNWTPSTNAVQYTQNNASAWVWCLTNAAQNNTIEFGTAANTGINPRNAANNYFGRINDLTGRSIGSQTSSIGFYGTQRTSATAINDFKNGATLAAAGNVASTSLPASAFWICGGNSTAFGVRQVSMAAAGASLSGLESTFYNIMLDYMQAVGAA